MTEHSYILQLIKTDGTVVGQTVVFPDWDPAVEWTRLLAVRAGKVGISDVIPDPAILPVWDSRVGEPHLSGFACEIGRGKDTVRSEFSIDYWKGLAKAESAELMEKGLLKAGEYFYYRALAYPRSGAADHEPESLVVTEVPSPVCLKKASFAEFMMRSSGACGLFQEEAMPVFIHKQVLDEASILKEQARDSETGGILIGHLNEDPQAQTLFAEITAQIPAKHARSDLTRLTFTADTWADARAAIDLRRSDEIPLGWWHTHPVKYWSESNSGTQSAYGDGIFSAEDMALHRTVFVRAFNVALVLSDKSALGWDWTVSFALYGWRRGMVEQSGFYVLGDAMNRKVRRTRKCQRDLRASTPTT